tara:strand:+ start:47558 stop:48784 length:1227 start_codon:yes stop_codon:yes gene_type:complete
MKNTILIIALTFVTQFGFGQEFPKCGQEDHINYALQELTNRYGNYPFAETDSISGTVNIPVVVHIVYKTISENIADSLVYNQIGVLNEDFQMRNSDTANIRMEFKAVKGNPKVNFCLAKVDPDGNQTSGITRTQTNKDFFITFSNNMMVGALGGKDPWPTDQYLNIWVVKLVNASGQGQTGFAVFPWNASPTYDGVVINYGQFGDNNGDSFYGDGRIATHEVGHYLGLSHNFKGGCGGSVPANCTIGGDSICDTPPQRTWIQGCQPGMVSCGNKLAQWENFMDYAIQGCRVMFTHDQAEKMRMNINKWWFRKSLAKSTACGPNGLANEKVKGLVKMYPNPSNSLVTFESSNAQSVFIQVLDVRGQNILEFEITNSIKQLDISTFNTGIYIVKMRTEDGQVTSTRLIKK